jgi:hypothetical protein
MNYTFYDSHNIFGFGVDTEVFVKIDYTCNAGCEAGWSDPGYPPECTINSCTITGIVTANNEYINWSTLCPEKQREVSDWAHNQADNSEVHDACFQEASDLYDSY